LHYPVSSHLLRHYLHQFGAVHVFVGKLGDAIGKRGGEEQTKPFLGVWHVAQQITHILDEAEVKHAVGLIQHHYLNGAQIEHMLLEVVDDSAWRTDEDIDPRLKCLALAFVAGTAIGEAECQAGVAAYRFGILVDLHGEFAGGCQHQGARLIDTAIFSGGFGKQAVVEGDEECGGLAGPCLCLSCYILSRKRQWQRRRLYWSAIGKACLFNTL
jgi:hypothetical protein